VSTVYAETDAKKRRRTFSPMALIISDSVSLVFLLSYKKRDNSHNM